MGVIHKKKSRIYPSRIFDKHELENGFSGATAIFTIALEKPRIAAIGCGTQAGPSS